MNAPEFPAGLSWLNTEKPLKISDLKGKVVLIDFWTYCCINCLHIIPDLKKLEQEFADELIVIGVHSAKFFQERDTENIRQAILRNEIEHPVVNDNEFKVWQLYAAKAWPTLVLIDPDGKLVTSASGEGVYKRFADSISKLITEFDHFGKINRSALKLKRESDSVTRSELSFPGKIHADPRNNRLFIADQNNNRIVICNMHSGEILETIGSGKPGLKDGSFGDAAFLHPQGMVLINDLLYIADTDNHAVRVANMLNHEVSTISGDGTQADMYQKPDFGDKVKLSSPWDLTYRDAVLYISMAGTHQIWSVRLSDTWTEPFAGTANEGLRDGVRTNAWLAQPSGIICVDEKLYFLDSEVSALRYVEIFPKDGRVGTIVGKDLFEFGDVDGHGVEVRLQHPLGITWHKSKIYIADTYNNKIKVIDPWTRITQTIAGSGKSGSYDGPANRASFYEPGGLDYANEKLYIADTNNHSIRVLDLRDQEVTTLPVMWKEPAEKTRLSGKEKDVTAKIDTGKIIRLKPGACEVNVTFSLPESAGLNPESELTIELTRGCNLFSIIGNHEQVLHIPVRDKTTFNIPVDCKPESGIAEFEFNYVYCNGSDKDHCLSGHTRKRFTIVISSQFSASSFDILIKPEQDQFIIS